MKNKRKLSVLGSTGSIGVQTLDVLSKSIEDFEIISLTANNNIQVLEQQCKTFLPKNVVIANYDSYKEFKKTTSFKGEILFGDQELIRISSNTDNDLIVSSLVGFAGVQPTLAAINNNINVALANKETLVSAGNLITNEAKKNNVELLAIDSEHSAILQCLVGEDYNSIEKIILTASGGPFRNTNIKEFESITVSQALNHPNWSMGSKITIDSATMMNKGFEVIEAYWLFNIPVEKIDVIIHPESIIHSFVQFTDGSMKAQLGLPDMRIPISYALNYPNRLNYDFPRLNLNELSNLTFQTPDYEKYPCLKIAFETINKGGNAPAVMNAANEVAVEAFLNKKIKFTDIFKLIEKTLEKSDFIENPGLSEIIESDSTARILTKNFIH